MKTLLSIDFDFFIREDPKWDFGHNEANEIFMNAAWLARYLSIDLYKETNIKRYADFNPKDIISKLKWLGFKLENPRVVIADSHKHAYNETKKLKECRIFNFDAHHDYWDDEQKVSCANWLLKSEFSHYTKELTWIPPSWLRKFDYELPQSSRIETLFCDTLEENQFKNIKVDTIFLCRSGCWVPPHHDLEFFKMVKLLKSVSGGFEIVENIEKRKFPSKAKAKKILEDNKKMIESLRIPKNSVIF